MFEKQWESIKGKSNVVGYSKRFRKRIRDGVKIDEDVFRVYVSKKVPLSYLKLGDIIPAYLVEGIPTDIVEIGKPTAPPPGGVLEYEFLDVIERVRPLVAGISIGNWSITAGTLGWFFKDGKGQEVLGSNAHVFAEDPLRSGSLEKRIVQPGRFDGGTTEDIVAEYLWHEPLGGSECTPSNLITGTLNAVYRGLGRKTRYTLELNEAYKIDFGVAIPSVEFSEEIYGVHSYEGFVGLGFAGSDKTSFFCKATSILEAGWSPMNVGIRIVHIGDLIHKVGRTSEYTSGRVIDDSVHGKVDYGNFNVVEFDDLILTEKMLEGGDSGSSAWKEMNLESR